MVLNVLHLTFTVLSVSLPLRSSAIAMLMVLRAIDSHGRQSWRCELHRLLHRTVSRLPVAVQQARNDVFVSSLTDESGCSNSITAILVARFMLDLQKAKQKSQHHGDSDIISMARFDRALGSIGSTLAASDVWRQGPGPTSDFAYAEGRPDDLLFMKFEPDVFGKGVVTSMILEAESTPSLEKGRVSESETV